MTTTAAPAPAAAPQQHYQQPDHPEYPNNPVTQMFYSMENAKVQEENRYLKEINAAMQSQQQQLLLRLAGIEERLFYLESFISYNFNMQAAAAMQMQPYPPTSPRGGPGGHYQQQQPAATTSQRPRAVPPPQATGQN